MTEITFLVFLTGGARHLVSACESLQFASRIFCMKNQFVIFVFVLLYLLAISIAGCSRGSSELTPMEELAGEYMLVELKMSIDKTTLSVKPPNVFGELVLENGNRYFSLTVVITDEVGLVNDNRTLSYDSWRVDGDSWDADETILIVKEHNDTEYSGFEYTWDGKYLTLDDSEEGITLTMKWRKL